VIFDTLSGRIFATLAAVLALLLVAAAVFGEIKIRSFHQAEVDVRLSNAADLLVAPAADVLAGRTAKAAFTTRIQDLGRATHLRLTIIDASGQVVADSEAALPLPNHADRPEVKDALDHGAGFGERRSATTGKPTRYIARRIDEEGRPLGLVRAAAEFDEMESAVSALRQSIVFAGVLALALGIAASAFLARRLSRPLEAIGRNAAAVASGDLDGRIHADGPLEVRELADALSSIVREMRHRVESVRRARSEIETILSSMAEGVVAVDPSERVLLMNDAAARLLALEAPLSAGSALWEHLRFPELESALRSALAGAGAWHADASSPRGDGRTLALSVAPVGRDGVARSLIGLQGTNGRELPRVPLSRTLATRSGEPAHDASLVEKGSLLGAVALLSDVTAIRRLEQMRIDFVANVSHELRTPLSAVMGALETLSDPVQDEVARERFLDIGRRNAARLQAIVADLLDLSAIEAEGDRMPVAPTRIIAPLKAAASALSGAAEAKGVKLLLPSAPDAGIVVNGNNQRLEQVFTNLLENALKYTPSGGRVSVYVRSNASSVSVDIEDTGIGIPATSLPRVFERFYRVDRSRSREMGGTGLGLAIVKHVMRAHGGTVDVKSEEGRGSTFTITLPRLSEAVSRQELGMASER
jgi:two-component system phosphate regulon sensor histidine kinase PhoR